MSGRCDDPARAGRGEGAMTDIYDPANFEKVCVNTVMEALRESAPLKGPRAYYLCHHKTAGLTTSFRYHLVVILFEHREELLTHLERAAGTLATGPDEGQFLFSLMQTFIGSLLVPITTRRLVEDPRATTGWLAREIDILSRSLMKP